MICCSFEIDPVNCVESTYIYIMDFIPLMSRFFFKNFKRLSIEENFLMKEYLVGKNFLKAWK